MTTKEFEEVKKVELELYLKVEEIIKMLKTLNQNQLRYLKLAYNMLFTRIDMNKLKGDNKQYDN